MNFMYEVLEKAQKEINQPDSNINRTEYYNTGINTAWLKLEKYYKLTDVSPLYVAAIVLHPGWRFDYFEDKWAKHPSWIKNAKKAFKNLFQAYCERVSNADPAFEFESVSQTQTQQTDPKSSYMAYEGFSDAYLSRKYEKQKKKDTESLELDNYLRSLDYRRAGNVKDPLVWWKEHQADFPILSRMAFDLFSIPAMSSEVERIFSIAKKMITDERNCLGPEVVEACQTQRHWWKAGLVS